MDDKLTSKTGEKLAVEDEKKCLTDEDEKIEYLIKLRRLTGIIPECVIRSNLNTSLGDNKAEYKTLIEKYHDEKNKDITNVINSTNEYASGYIQNHPEYEEKIRIFIQSQIQINME